MNAEFANQLNVFKTTSMILSDAPTRRVDELFFHGRSHGDDTGLFEKAGSLYRTGIVRNIVIANNEGERYGNTIPFEATPGKTEYRRRLILQSVPDADILDPEAKAFHTRMESDSFIDLSQKMSWRSAAVLAQPHQLLRIMLCTISSMREQAYEMDVFAVTPAHVNWQEKVPGSQGENIKPRHEHPAEELEKVLMYQATGEMAGFEELFDYLNQRDARS